MYYYKVGSRVRYINPYGGVFFRFNQRFNGNMDNPRYINRTGILLKVKKCIIINLWRYGK